jgi:hypothetical protein
MLPKNAFDLRCAAACPTAPQLDDLFGRAQALLPTQADKSAANDKLFIEALLTIQALNFSSAAAPP